MTYKTRCNGNCVERIDRQAETIYKLRDENLIKTQSLNQAWQVIEQFDVEIADLTQALNRAGQTIEALEAELKLYKQQYNFRPDQNWDGGFRAEVSE